MDSGDRQKDYLHRALIGGRAALLSRLDGLSEFDLRRPMTRTGTNLLGLVKHLVGMEAGYLGEALGRPFPERLRWYEDGRGWNNEDMWATASESCEYILGLYRHACAHSDSTISSLDLGSIGRSAEDGHETTLLVSLVTVLGETNRHGGHADIVRELIDGRVGANGGNPMLAFDVDDDEAWARYVDQLTRTAEQFRTPPSAS